MPANVGPSTYVYVKYRWAHVKGIHDTNIGPIVCGIVDKCTLSIAFGRYSMVGRA